MERSAPRYDSVSSEDLSFRWGRAALAMAGKL
jgi:hypothetical protein